MFDVTFSYVGLDSFIFVTYLNHMCDMTRGSIRRKNCITTCVTSLVHVCDLTSLCV